MPSLITWSEASDAAFVFEMKKAVQSPPTLGIPDPTKPFIQAVDEREGCLHDLCSFTEAWLQSQACCLFFSQARPGCCRPAEVPACHSCSCKGSVSILVGYALLTLLVPHAVSLILAEQKTWHLSAARYLRYHTCQLDMPNVKVKHCNTLNPASLMPLPTDVDPHDCVAELDVICSPRPDLTDEPRTNAVFVLYTDGSAF